MRFATKPHPVDGGLDRHARTMDLGVLKPAGASWLPRTMQATRDGRRRVVNGEGPLGIPVDCTRLVTPSTLPMWQRCDCHNRRGLAGVPPGSCALFLRLSLEPY
jgi:hypothetical protein